MNKKILSFFATAIAISPIVAFATHDTMSSVAGTNANGGAVYKPGQEVRKEAKEDIKEIRIGRKQEIKEIKENAQNQRRDAATDVRMKVGEAAKDPSLTKDEKTAKIKEIQGSWVQKKIELMNKSKEDMAKIEAIRVEAKNKIQEKRETLKNDLSKIKDARKAQTVVNVDGKLEKINEERTYHLLANLGQIEGVLGKISVRAENAQSKGINITSVKQAIDSAKTAINSSRTAIEAQAAKVYKITISTENNLRSDVGAAMKNLQNDLNKARETVRVAHDAVRKAAVSLAQTVGEGGAGGGGGSYSSAANNSSSLAESSSSAMSSAETSSVSSQ